jgi:hypothetical protein
VPLFKKYPIFTKCVFYGLIALILFGAAFPYLSEEVRFALVGAGAMKLYEVIKLHGGWGDQKTNSDADK